MRTILLSFLCLAATAVSIERVAASEEIANPGRNQVSEDFWNPPADWLEFEPLLVSSEAWDRLPKPPKVTGLEKSSGSEILLNHRYHRIREDGSSLSVRHVVARLLTEERRDEFSAVSIPVRPAFQKLSLVRAHSILPSGERVPVEGKAVFVEKEENQ